jgi:hypothetical protein
LAFTTSYDINPKVFDKIVEAVYFPALRTDAKAVPVFEHDANPAIGFGLREIACASTSK